jgi:hypothetical protein
MIDKPQESRLAPSDPKSRDPLPQKKQPGYYPRFSTLSQKKFWDAATRKAIERRVERTPPIRFFSAKEKPIVEAVCGRVIPQDDRLPERRIPIVPVIDERLWSNTISGYRFEDMPDDREAYRLGLQAIDKTAMAMHQKSFASLSPLEQDAILKSIHDGQELAAHEIWKRMPMSRFWHLLVQDCMSAYYAHPWAWDEIGFGGPAYPRAYIRLESGMPEPWEEDEQRYEWDAPPTSLSDTYEVEPSSAKHPQQGQGGTH